MERAAVCSDCHEAHEILTASDSKSPIFKFNVPDTCGKCHGNVEQEFKQSIHGQAIGRGEWQPPVCTDCDGIHSIKSHKDPKSSVAAQNLAKNTCARCHEGVRLSQEFGFEASRVTTYLAGWPRGAARLSSPTAQAAMACTTSCLRAIPGRVSIPRTW